MILNYPKRFSDKLKEVQVDKQLILCLDYWIP